MAEHELKTIPPYFNSVWNGSKPFEVRVDDRGFTPMDTLRLREWDNDKGYTGREIKCRVGYIMRLSLQSPCPDAEYRVVMAIKDVRKFNNGVAVD